MLFAAVHSPLLAQSGHPLVAPHMSAIGCKADMRFALQMSAYDPKADIIPTVSDCPRLSPKGNLAATQIELTFRQHETAQARASWTH